MAMSSNDANNNKNEMLKAMKFFIIRCLGFKFLNIFKAEHFCFNIFIIFGAYFFIKFFLMYAIRKFNF